MKSITLPQQKPYTGVLIGIMMILLWGIMLALNLSLKWSFDSPWTYLRILIQTHLFTGLFITAHDAMHGTVAPKNKQLNHLIGKVCTALFIFNSYKILRPKHYEHHKHPGTEHDPDFHNGHPGFFHWYIDFLKEYVTWWQIALAAITFNVAAIWIEKPMLILFWVVPSFLATFQLFYFGTYLPHKGEPDNRHHSRSQSKNHLVAFLTCYFFGYHYEHHDSPVTAWWRLWKLK